MKILKDFWEEESGAMSIEAAIIVAVLVALAIIFKKQIADMWKGVSAIMTEQTEKIKES